MPRLRSSSEPRRLLEVVVDVDGLVLRFFNTHLSLDQSERAKQIPVLLERVLAEDAATVLTGDFNAEPDAPELVPVRSALVDAWDAAGIGPGSTRPSGGPRFRHDYIFVSSHVEVERATVAAVRSSDHRPLIADLALRVASTR